MAHDNNNENDRHHFCTKRSTNWMIFKPEKYFKKRKQIAIYRTWACKAKAEYILIVFSDDPPKISILTQLLLECPVVGEQRP